MNDLPISELEALRRAADCVGGQAELARKLGLRSRRNVWPWFNGRRVPAEYCPAIEKATMGAVRCEDLRRDVEWSVLRSAQPCQEARDAA